MISPSPHGQSGLSLIEIMIAVVVLSIGLLGTAALTAVSVRNTQSANYRTQATNLAYDAIDMMRGNMNDIGYYNMSAFTVGTTACPAVNQAPFAYATSCATTRAAASCNIDRWAQELCYTLPEGRGRIQVNVTRGAAGVITSTIATVTVRWCDDRARVDTAGDCGLAMAADTGVTELVVRGGL